MTPPPAPDLLTIFDVEGQVEPKLQDGLRADGIFDVMPTRSTNGEETPRVEARLHLGECIRKAKLPVAGAEDAREALPEAWKCTLVLHVVTDRINVQQREAHGRGRATVRLFGARFFSRLNRFLRYHRFESLTEAGTTPKMINEDVKTEDISRLQFTGVIAVRASAWPT